MPTAPADISFSEPSASAEAENCWSLLLLGGGVRLSRGKRTVILRNRKVQAILGYLALHPSRRASREQIAGLLWSESPEVQARASLRQALRALRQVLAAEGCPGILVDREDTSLAEAGIQVDVWQLVNRVQAGNLDAILVETRNLSELLLAQLEDVDPAFRSWLLVQRQSLHERLVLALEARLAELEKQQNGFRLAKTVALALSNLDPTHEGACRQLMLASALEGDVAGALRRYNALWDLLDNEYDVEPSEETQRLVASIKLGVRPAANAAPATAVATAEYGDPREKLRLVNGSERRCRIMVGPFEAAGIDPEQRYLVSGFRHQLISSLIRFREWSLIDGARMPVVPALAEPMYLIVASAYQAQGQLQLVLTLSDAVTGEYVWSENVEAALSTWFSVQKLVVRRLAIALNVHLSADRLDRTLGQPDVSLALYDRWLRGEALTRMWRGKTRMQAADIFKSIIEEAPRFAPAYCSLVNFSNSRSHIFPGELRTPDRKRETLDLARVAVQLDATFSRTHLCAAWSYALNGHFDQAELSFEMAYELNENDPWTMISSSLGLAFCGRKDRALRRADLAQELGLSLEPRHWGYRAVIGFLCHDYQGCVDAADRAQDAIYNFAAWKAAALTHLGRHDAARAEWRRFVDLVSRDWYADAEPDHDAVVEWLLQGFPIKSRGDWERLRNGIPSAAARATALAD